MRKILVTTDYSTNSKAGVRFAIQFASQSSAEIIFYHVHEGVADNNWNPKKKNENPDHDLRLEKLHKFINSIYTSSQLPLVKFRCVVEVGFDTNNMILNFAKQCKADYICISTRGGGTLKKLLGTTTSALIEKSTTPVLVVPKTYRIKPINEIWYSSDLANLKSELTKVQKFALPFKANIHVYYYDFMIEVDEIMNKLNKVAAKYTTKGTYFHFKKMKIDHTISHHLQNDMTKHKPSLVVLFTKQNRSWIDRLFYRNNTKEVTFDTKTPLLILKKTTK
jgi:nucleotide-binding universal stress UspA family protein